MTQAARKKTERENEDNSREGGGEGTFLVTVSETGKRSTFPCRWERRGV
jgi:hypothetical protein